MTETTPAPDIDTIECAAEILGCSSWFQGQTRIVCETHSNTDWPCPETVGLATKLAARDACRGRAAVAALARVQALVDSNPDHADTCGSVLTPGAGYPCSCWQADLRAALAEPTGQGGDQ